MLGLDCPDISPAALVESLEEFADTDDADIYLSDIRSAGEVLIAYANAAEPVIARLAEARKEEAESSSDSAKQPLNLVMPPSWWQWLGEWADQRERGVGILGTDPEPWEVLTAFSEAIRSQFSSEGGSDE